MRHFALAFILLTSASAAVAAPGASAFTLVNGTPAALGELSIRRAGTTEWKPLAVSPAAGAKSSIQFKDPDCAFDIRSGAGGSAITWTGVNLCDVKSVTLKKDDAAGAWVDYDQ